MTVLITTKIGRDFRVTIPKEVRDLLNLKEGDDLILCQIRDEKGRVCFRKSGH